MGSFFLFPADIADEVAKPKEHEVFIPCVLCAFVD